MGTIKGGSLTIRSWPSTMWVSLLRARKLSLARAFATLDLNFFPSLRLTRAAH